MRIYKIEIWDSSDRFKRGKVPTDTEYIVGTLNQAMEEFERWEVKSDFACMISTALYSNNSVNHTLQFQCIFHEHYEGDVLVKSVKRKENSFYCKALEVTEENLPV